MMSNEKKGTIKVRQNKKGKLFMEIKYDDGKNQPLVSFKAEKGYDDEPCTVELMAGQIKNVTLKDGRVLVKNDSKKRSGRPPVRSGMAQQSPVRDGRSTHGQILEKATAPYNFVPLNDKSISGIKRGSVKLDRYYPENSFLSGYIELDIETRTPLYIKGTESRAERDERETNNKNEKPTDSPFFSPGNKVKIPGSSIRGMVRSLVEIASYSRFIKDRQFEERTLYYRGVADKTSLKGEYDERLTSRNGVKAGFLLKRGREYFIRPADEKKGSTYYRVTANNVSNISVKEYSYREIYFSINSVVTNQREEIIVQEVSSEKVEGFSKGYLVVSGPMRNKKKHWIINTAAERNAPIRVPPEVVNSYDKDENRNSVNLLTKKDDLKNGDVPCFFVTDKDGKVTSFGHTEKFRLAYGKSIGEHVPPELREPKVEGDCFVDISEAIFGKEAVFSSRVFFEDAKMMDSHPEPFIDYTFTKILSGPKPTTFQHYLNQGDSVSHRLVAGRTRNTWNSDAYIRGYKYYWHRDINKKGYLWQEKPETAKKKPRQYTMKIKPVKEGIKFKGRIRFDNLSGGELGALLFVLELPGNCCHKLGMGKPLGLGSVKIKPTLKLVNRCERYTRLFSGGSWHLSEKHIEMGDFVKAFEDYVLSKLNKAGSKDGTMQTLWETARMKELKAILDWDNNEKGDWLAITSYLEIETFLHGEKTNQFSERPVLPSPREVIKTK